MLDDDLMGSGSYEQMKRKVEDRTLRRKGLRPTTHAPETGAINPCQISQKSETEIRRQFTVPVSGSSVTGLKPATG